MSMVGGDGKESAPSSSLPGSEPCRNFEFPEIQLATNDFDESLVIGHGGFGKVYKGTISNGSTPVDVAIKRLDSMSNQGAKEFWAEVEMLSKLRHCNLVSLIGYCNHGKEMILVYEYMPNGTLEDHLHNFGNTLSCLQRLKICLGASRGLHYLHTGTGIDVGVIHRDIKSSNILLHESWTAKNSDFGLSKIGPTNQLSTGVSTLVRGTFGYLDPDHYATGKLTRKSDVYAFGVVLLEVLCRKRAVDKTLGEEQWNLARWAQESIKEGNLKHIIDPEIRGEISPKCLKKFVEIAERCLQSDRRQRCTMTDVVAGLEYVLSLQEKHNISLQPGGRTIFGRMVGMLPFPSNGDNSELSAGVKKFKFADLKSATSNFREDRVLLMGNFREVFLGWIDINTLGPSTPGVGTAVAVKRVNQANRKERAKFQTEVMVLERLHHPNIISLLGYCNDEHEYLLVFEHKCISPYSFDHFLYPAGPHMVEPISWKTRLHIMIGVARGLAYMHSTEVIYRNVKSSNILLDHNGDAKLGDFGFVLLATITCLPTRDMDVWGYVDPHYRLTGLVSKKNDIYGFGVVLIETLAGRPTSKTIQHDEQDNLLLWGRRFQPNEFELKKIMDQRLKDYYPLKGALKCFALALRCLAFKPKDRPSSEEVLRSLEQIYSLKS